jgi:hypothetical protein
MTLQFDYPGGGRIAWERDRRCLFRRGDLPASLVEYRHAEIKREGGAARLPE